jgi:ATP:ADP antiporter, AAA family
VQSLTGLSQVYFTGRLVKRFGVKALVAFVPMVMLGGFVALAF